MKKRISKYNMEQIQLIVKEKNCKLLENEYVNMKTKMKFECGCGNEFITCLDKFLNRNQNLCLSCSKEKSNKNLRNSLDYIREVVFNLGCTFESCDYKNTRSLIDIRCSCGKLIKRAFGDIRANKEGNMVCNDCLTMEKSEKQRHSLDYVKNIIELNGCFWVDGEYKNNESQLYIKCKCGENFYTDLNSFTNKTKPKTQCNQCGFDKRNDSSRLSFEYVQKEVESRDCVLISDCYKNGSTKMIIQCKCGKDFKTTFINFITKNKNRCDKCTKKQSKGEIEIEKVLLEKKIPYKTQFTISECKYKKPLKFDFCIFDSNEFKTIKLLIEYDGEQHFMPISRFGGHSSFEKQAKKDNIKNEYCEKNNLQLIRIPYYDFKNIKNTILNILDI